MKWAHQAASFFAVSALVSCAPRAPDFQTVLGSPSGEYDARVRGYQPRGTIEGYVTVQITRGDQKGEIEPQLTFGHLQKLKVGWINDRTLAFVADELELSQFCTPVYLAKDSDYKEVHLVTCSTRQIDCSSLLERIRPGATKLDVFPEGGWEQLGYNSTLDNYQANLGSN